MAYRRRYSSRTRGTYGRRRTARSRTRRRRVGRARTARVVIQVVGAGPGAAVAPLSLGKKSNRPVKARF